MSETPSELPPGTIDLLVMKALTLGPQHGYGIVRLIQTTTDDVLQVEEGSLYPALHRMESRGWIVSEWGTSENNRRARFYRLTRSGRRRLEARIGAWERMVRATRKVLTLAPRGH